MAAGRRNLSVGRQLRLRVTVHRHAYLRVALLFLCLALLVALSPSCGGRSTANRLAAEADTEQFGGAGGALGHVGTSGEAVSGGARSQDTGTDEGGTGSGHGGAKGGGTGDSGTTGVRDAGVRDAHTEDAAVDDADINDASDSDAVTDSGSSDFVGMCHSYATLYWSEGECPLAPQCDSAEATTFALCSVSSVSCAQRCRCAGACSSGEVQRYCDCVSSCLPAPSSDCRSAWADFLDCKIHSCTNTDSE